MSPCYEFPKDAPFPLACAGKTSRCHPAYKGWQIVHTHNHWFKEEMTLMYIEDITVPFVDRKREDLDLNDD